MSKPAKYTLGPLEQSIMEVVWRTGRVSVRQVLEALRKRQSAYTTIMTVMNRLVSQSVLRRSPGENGAFVYAAVLDREAFCTAASRQAIDALVQQYGAVAIAQFMDRLDRVPADRLAALRRQLRKQ